MPGGKVLISQVDVTLAIDIMSVNGASPGYIVADCLSVSPPPRGNVTITLAARGVTMVWGKVRVVEKGRPQPMGGYYRLVMEDSRWIMRETIMQTSFNEQLIDGRVPVKTSLADLWAKLAAATGLNIATNDLPDLYPPCPWKGMTAEKAANRLLEQTVCRMNYDPVGQTYRVMPASHGVLPDVSERRRKHIPVQLPNQLVVKTGPKLIEGLIECKAVVPDADGIMVAVAGNAEFDIMDLFTGFHTLADDRRTVVRNSAFRVWEPTTRTPQKEILRHRLETIVPSPGYSENTGIEAEATGMINMPMFHETPTGKGVSLAQIELDDMGERFVADRPVLCVSGGVIQTNVDMRCAYRTSEADGNPTREQVTRAIGGPGAEKEIIVDWVIPVESSLAYASIDTTEWSTILDTVADALQAMWLVTREQITIQTLIDGGGIGKLGAVRYRAQVRPFPLLVTTLYVNHTPPVGVYT